MLGIEPTQMDELRKREGFRLVVEERLLEVRDLVVSVFQTALYFGSVMKAFGKFTMKHTKIILLALIALTIMLW